MRTRDITHQETRQRILKSARHLLLEGGHAGLSLRAVAKEAGFSPAGLYEYFASKEELVGTLAAEAGASLGSALGRAIPSGARDRSALVALGRAYIRWSKQSPEDFLLFFSRLPSRRRSDDEATAKASPYGVVLAAVEEAGRAGAVRARGTKQVERLAYALWAAAHGAAMLQLTHLSGFRADFASADKALLEALLKGWRG